MTKKLIPETRSGWCRVYLLGLETLALLTFGYVWLAEAIVQHRSYPRSPAGDIWVLMEWSGDPHRQLSRLWVIVTALLLLSSPLFFRVRRSWGWLAVGTVVLMVSLAALLDWLERLRLL